MSVESYLNVSKAAHRTHPMQCCVSPAFEEKYFYLEFLVQIFHQYKDCFSGLKPQTPEKENVNIDFIYLNNLFSAIYLIVVIVLYQCYLTNEISESRITNHTYREEQE